MFNILNFPRRDKSTVELSDTEVITILAEMERNRDCLLTGNRTLREQLLTFYRYKNPKHKDRKIEYSHYTGFVLSVTDKMSGWIQIKCPISKASANTLLHLRISIARLAMLDEEFFYESGHSVRILLDKIATALAGSENIENDEIFRELQSAVLAIDTLVDQVDEPAQAVLKVINRENQRIGLTAKRIRTSIITKVKMDEAQDTAERAINELLELYTVPEPMTRLLKLWKDYLVKEQLKERYSRKAWVQDIDRLADILALLHTTAQKQGAISAEGGQPVDWSRIYQQKSDIAQVMDVVNYSPKGREPLLRAFEAIYQQFEKGMQVVMLKVSVKEKFHCAPDFDIGFATPSELELALQLKVGDWIEFDVNSEKPFKAKLIAKIPEASSMVFMRRNGPKLFEKHYSEIAMGLQNKFIRRLDFSRIFTRAISAAVASVGGKCARVSDELMSEQLSNHLS